MGEVKLKGKPYPKQIIFFTSIKKYNAYGGARGGGKSWALRRKLVLMAMKYPGIQILLIRRTLKDLRKNHELPLQSELKDIARYDKQNKEFHFPNGAMLCLGYCDSEGDVIQYQGQSYDVIGVEEATQFTEFQKDCLTECCRRSITMQGDFTSRMYFTCNPGGVGHMWVKRLFIDREYKNSESPDDYSFTASNVYDNDYIMNNDPQYVKTLENLPEMRKRAMLYGDWDAFEGQYFSEWNRNIHVVQPFQIPSNWLRFRSLDYGMDITACYWWAVDMQGNCYVYRELHEPNLILSAAAKRIIELTPKEEKIAYTVASPDLWNKRQDSGESGFEIMVKQGLPLIKANNSRIAGWRTMREYLKPINDMYNKKSSRFKIFINCVMAIKNIPLLQYDDKKIEDASNNPHDITHAPEAIRYGIMSRPRINNIETPKHYNWEFEKPQINPMLGGDLDESYINGVF